ncbi:MAG: LuxR C-terminal-related transcriptional regulator, partial [Halobacteriales archaeon]|nr:LuxR C-terminal-related transcriptional regulator [Halobacteriales archaeon]
MSDSRLTAEIVAAALGARGFQATAQVLGERREAENPLDAELVVLTNGVALSDLATTAGRPTTDSACRTVVVARNGHGDGTHPGRTSDQTIRPSDVGLGEIIDLLGGQQAPQRTSRNGSAHRTHAVSPETALVRQLTPREREVLRVLMGGSSYRGVAEQLDVAVGTVRSHVQSIRAKLGASSVIEAVAVARRAG